MPAADRAALGAQRVGGAVAVEQSTRDAAHQEQFFDAFEWGVLAGVRVREVAVVFVFRAAGGDGAVGVAPVDDGSGDVVGHVGKLHQGVVARGVDVQLPGLFGQAKDGKIGIAVIRAEDPEIPITDLDGGEIVFREIRESVLLLGKDADDVLFAAPFDRGGLERCRHVGRR